MFCDEPTSGLSATDAELCVRALKLIAKKFGGESQETSICLLSVASAILADQRCRRWTRVRGGCRCLSRDLQSVHLATLSPAAAFSISSSHFATARRGESITPSAVPFWVACGAVLIFVVIHQPRIEVAKLFDSLVLLTAQPGRIVYNGPMKDAVAHWEQVGYPVPPNANPADHFLDMVTPGAPKAEVDKFVAAYKENMAGAVERTVKTALASPGADAMEMLQAEREAMLKFGDVPAITRSVYGVGFCTQLSKVMGRKIWMMKADIAGSVGAILGSKIFFGLMLGTLYFGKGDEQPLGITQLAMVSMLLMMVALGGQSNMVMTAVTLCHVASLAAGLLLLQQWSSC